MNRTRILKEKLRTKNKVNIMKKDDDFPPHEFLPIEGGEVGGPEGFWEDEEGDFVTLLEDFCEGFSFEQKLNFLKELGFTILNRKSKSTGEQFDIALSPSQLKNKKSWPKESNIDSMFVQGISDCILKILLKYGKD